MSEELEVEEEVDEEGEPLELDPKIRQIYPTPSNPEVIALRDRWESGRLDLQPDFQRYFHWEKAKQDALIESVIGGIPISIIYFYEEDDGTITTIDGQQRLTTLFNYIRGDFKLRYLTLYPELKGNVFSDLNETIQDRIKRYPLHVIEFKSGSDKRIKYELFARLNKGAKTLNEQELRNCVYRGEYNNLLQELAKDRDFLYLLGQENPHERMTDVELVLRFAAFYHSGYLQYKPSMKQFFNKEMESYKDEISESDARDLRRTFKQAVTLIKSLLGKNAFRRFHRGAAGDKDGHWDRKLNKSLFDILMFSFSKIERRLIQNNLDSIREALIDLMTNNEEFISSIQIGTSSKKVVQKRFKIWFNTLEDIIGDEEPEPRCFSAALKREYFERNQTCAICGNAILDIDDAHMDHIKQYADLGKTVPENARLVHRYCNWTRSRKE